MWISDFGVRLKEEEVFELIVKYMEGLGYIVRAEDVQMVLYTNGRSEFIIRRFEKK